ncbi:MAG: hypothetical protein C0505_07095 [Leptothrix sp. (in: Bacteria)]|nr:hypothetical protein [Leptothrix sp. (in: b-proteobacteria)]
MRKLLLPVAFGLAMLSMSAAQAQSGQGYLGGAVGLGNISVNCADLESCDKSNTGGKLYGGYRFPSHWAVEAVYFDWGKVTGRYTDTVVPAAGNAVPLATSPITVTVDGKLRASGWGLGAAYIAPLASHWNGVARLGVMRNKGKITGTGSALGVTLSETSSTSATFAYFGLGVGYNLTPNLAITGEADFSRVKYGAEDAFDKDNVRLLSLGLRYAF